MFEFQCFCHAIEIIKQIHLVVRTRQIDILKSVVCILYVNFVGHVFFPYFLLTKDEMIKKGAAENEK